MHSALITLNSLNHEVEKLTGHSWSTMTYRRWMKAGVNGRILKSRKIGRRIFIEPDDLRDFLFPRKKNAKKRKAVSSRG
ncbi:hypothetical protein LF1_41540 [Rubripirellula obstinata]|uniref:Uncharacterized protein n=1 Tax=Rubripirellula obstinata TaxID=406547 RepID=A0A5B1CQE2_9BACT|nr:hypothetical protein LF1_41540 [Rubripirellula obstinata]